MAKTDAPSHKVISYFFGFDVPFPDAVHLNYANENDDYTNLTVCIYFIFTSSYFLLKLEKLHTLFLTVMSVQLRRKGGETDACCLKML